MTERTQIEFTNIADLLKASPFDPEHDLNQTLTEARFYEHFFVNLGKAAELSAAFERIIESTTEPNRVVFMRGFAGNGKTTFLKTFIRQHPHYRPIYYDIQQQRASARKEMNDTQTTTDEVQLLINRRLRSETNAAETFSLLYDKRDVLREEDFISAALEAYLERHPPDTIIDTTYMRHCTDQFELKDTFAVLFLHLFRTAKPREKTIVFFDNLDAAPMAYLADRFLEYFQDALLAALPVSRHELFADREIDFRDQYRFVFTLRDANEAVLNAHLAERIGFQRTPFVVSFDTESYKAGAEKRIDYIRCQPMHHLKSTGERFSSALGAIMADRYFRDVLLPLYNNDFREVASVLVRVIDRFNIEAPETKIDRKLDPRLRGVLPFGVVQDLVENNFLREYTTIAADQDGYCFVDRVMLTVLINASRYKRAWMDKNGAVIQPDSSPGYSLFFLVREVDRIYRDIGKVLESIARCFLAHQKNWVHLVTISNRPIEDQTNFIKTYGPLIQHAIHEDTSPQNGNPNREEQIQRVRIRNELNSILVRVNPAGFTYIRHILPHFEFYANLAKNQSSLFDNPLAPVDGDSKVYAFANKIDAVYQLAHKHVESMRLFYDTRYVDAGVAKDFPSSDFAFRHQGAARVARPKGHSHTIRIATAHIGYIDFFRRSLLDPENSFVTEPIDSEERRRINRLILARLRRYIALLRRAPDAAAANAQADDFESVIRGIASRGYSDVTTPIAIEGTP